MLQAQERLDDHMQQTQKAATAFTAGPGISVSVNEKLRISSRSIVPLPKPPGMVCCTLGQLGGGRVAQKRGEGGGVGEAHILVRPPTSSTTSSTTCRPVSKQNEYPPPQPPTALPSGGLEPKLDPSGVGFRERAKPRAAVAAFETMPILRGKVFSLASPFFLRPVWLPRWAA